MRLVKMAYADAIPLDLLRSEQDRVAREMQQTKRELTEAENADRQTNDLYEQAQALMRRGADIYARAEPDVRRQLTQSLHRQARDRHRNRAGDPRLTLAGDQPGRSTPSPRQPGDTNWCEPDLPATTRQRGRNRRTKIKDEPRPSF
jgi:hypothetical protein